METDEVLRLIKDLASHPEVSVQISAGDAGTGPLGLALTVANSTISWDIRRFLSSGEGATEQSDEPILRKRKYDWSENSPVDGGLPAPNNDFVDGDANPGLNEGCSNRSEPEATSPNELSSSGRPKQEPLITRLLVLDPDRTMEVYEAAAGVPDESMLVTLYQQLSNKALHGLYPTVWTKNGRFSARYDSLNTTIKGKKDRTIPNKEGLQWCVLFNKVIQCNVTLIPQWWKRIIVSIVRTSNRCPVYGRGGMAERAEAAGAAWQRLDPDESALQVIHTRTRVSSNTLQDTKDALIQEVIRLLHAASNRPGTQVDILSIGIDGLTTRNESLIWLHRQFPELNGRIIFVVPAEFPGSIDDFPTFPNGIRYGVFDIAEFGATERVPDTDNTSTPRDKTSRLTDIMDNIRFGKEGSNGFPYKEWTGGRATFRVCPNSDLETGVDPTRPTMSRLLR